VAGLRTVRGVSDSFVIVQRRPRWFSEDTRVLNAVCSSCEAWKLVRTEELQQEAEEQIIPDIPDCILRIACIRSAFFFFSSWMGC
jgi:hypothetical protein